MATSRLLPVTEVVEGGPRADEVDLGENGVEGMGMDERGVDDGRGAWKGGRLVL